MANFNTIVISFYFLQWKIWISVNFKQSAGKRLKLHIQSFLSNISVTKLSKYSINFIMPLQFHNKFSKIIKYSFIIREKINYYTLKCIFDLKQKF